MRNAITTFSMSKKVNLDLKSLELLIVTFCVTLLDDQRRRFD